MGVFVEKVRQDLKVAQPTLEVGKWRLKLGGRSYTQISKEIWWKLQNRVQRFPSNACPKCGEGKNPNPEANTLWYENKFFYCESCGGGMLWKGDKVYSLGMLNYLPNPALPPSNFWKWKDGVLGVNIQAMVHQTIIPILRKMEDPRIRVFVNYVEQGERINKEGWTYGNYRPRNWLYRQGSIRVEGKSFIKTLAETYDFIPNPWLDYFNSISSLFTVWLNEFTPQEAGVNNSEFELGNPWKVIPPSTSWKEEFKALEISWPRAASWLAKKKGIK